IARHLTEHVVAKTEQPATEDGHELAWAILRHLYADENRATSTWEDNSGAMPTLTWEPQPRGGAFAALLGLRGTGLLGEFSTLSGTQLWRELRGGVDAFGDTLNQWNAPVPTVLPAMDLALTPQQANFAGLHNGFAFSAASNEQLGGMQGFRAVWHGSLLVEEDGSYTFLAGAPTEAGEVPDFEAAKHNRWRVTLERGQRKWVLLNHRWVGEDAPASAESSLNLRRGVYDLTIEFEQPQSEFMRAEDVCPQVSGFQLKYAGPDTDDEKITVPLQRLFYKEKDAPLDDKLENLAGAAQAFLRERYVGTIRDMRRTYMRSFKALLFAHRFALFAQKRADSGQSELGYMLEHADDFAGTSYFQPNANFASHKASFNFNFLPVDDIYSPPSAGQDRRAAPRTKRRQALFDWWERLFDYVDMRTHTQAASERPVWLLFHEAAEAHEDNPAHLLRHMGVDHSHADRVLTYYLGHKVTSSDLEDERWAIRVWRTEMWIDALMAAFFCQNNDIRPARPDLWAGNAPLETANLNLTRFVRRGLIENGELRRYAEIKALNDALRLRARTALFAYLCGMDRVALPWGGHAKRPKELSELLLIDVEVGICEKASRVEEAITALQTLVQRTRLGLEPGVLSPAFVLAWDRHFATFRVWEACKRRHIYRENWIEWEELEKARHSEAFQYLEDQLRRSALTIPVPGGLEYWDSPELPPHPALTLLQRREPAIIERLEPAPEESDSRYGFGVMGTPERHARPGWLAPLPGVDVHEPDPGDDNGDGDNGDDDSGPPPVPITAPGEMAVVAGAPYTTLDAGIDLPFWIEAAVRLGARFVRVAAAGVPPAATGFAPRKENAPGTCCRDCGRDHKPMLDEYYFWLVDGRYYEVVTQDAEMQNLNWHFLHDLPTLLHWESEPLVYLAWCRVHNGEFQPPRWSSKGVRVSGAPDLRYLGRLADSLH
ncbi:MAG TPA: neuraminidase-like domain-containing protein, partial [Anaerolineales bacterium]